ncbi:MAG TPA: chaperone modulator CbpM, partial [Trebonia sp.]|nr:chaperone modulator CbpM [Trebonia sp.]
RDPAGQLWFSRSELAALARVQRLRAGFSLNYAAVGLVADLLDRIAVLEAALRVAQRRGR